MSHHPLVLCLGGGGGGGGKIQRHAVRKMGACSMLELRASNNIGAWGCGLTVSTTMMLAAGSAASRSSQIVAPITGLPAELDSKKKRTTRLQSNRNWHARRLHAGAQSKGGRRRERVSLRAAPCEGGRGSDRCRREKKTSLLVSWRWYEGSPVPALSLESAANLACAAAKASNIN